MGGSRPVSMRQKTAALDRPLCALLLGVRETAVRPGRRPAGDDHTLAPTGLPTVPRLEGPAQRGFTAKRSTEEIGVLAQHEFINRRREQINGVPRGFDRLVFRGSPRRLNDGY